MFLRALLPFTVAAASLGLSACTTLSGPDELFGSVAPAPAAPARTLPPPPGLSANPADAPLTPGRIGTPATIAAREEPEERVQEAPAMRVEALSDLPRRADGVMILPPGPRLDVIDIGAVRQGLADAPPRQSPPAGRPTAPAAPAAEATSPALAPAGSAPGGLL